MVFGTRDLAIRLRSEMILISARYTAGFGSIIDPVCWDKREDIEFRDIVEEMLKECVGFRCLGDCWDK